MKISIILLFLFFFPSLILADEPPSWAEFKVTSENGKYIAEVSKTRGKLNYKLAVFAISGQTKKEIWSCDYDYDGYPGGNLSNDGSSFAYVNQWYYRDKPVVSIYHNGKRTRRFRGKDFGIEKSKIGKTTSHECWLDEWPYIKGQGNVPPWKFVVTEDSSLALEIMTIDSKRYLIEAKTGKLSEAKRDLAILEGKPKLQESKVREIADAYAKKQGFKLEEYQLPEIEYDVQKQEWIIFYQGVPYRNPKTGELSYGLGDHFLVYVDDKTQDVRLYRGR